jgi:protein O-mannosyl-transferase
MMGRARPLALVAGVALLAGAPVLRNDLCKDGKQQIEHNPSIRSVREEPGNLLRLLARPYWQEARETQALWRPIPSFTLGATYLLAGERPAAYHAFGLAAHAACAAAVFAFGRFLLGSVPAALAGGILFAVHPVHTEVLADAVGRAESLAALFGILSLLAYARGGRLRDGRTRLALALFFLATLCKEGAFAIPAIALLYDLAVRPGAAGLRERIRAALPAWIAFAAVGALHLALRCAVLGTLTPDYLPSQKLDNPLLLEPFDVRLANALPLVSRGIALLAFPLRLSAEYGLAVIPVRGAGDPAVLLPGLLALLAVGGSLLALRRRPALGHCLCLSFLAWLPASNLPFATGAMFGERLLYLPSAGFCLALGAALTARLPGRAALGAVLLLGGLGAARSVARLGDWRDEFGLREMTAIRDAPDGARAQASYGLALARAGRREEGLARLRRALEIFPDYHHAHVMIAEVLGAAGDAAGAVAAMREAILAEARLVGGRAPNAPLLLYGILRNLQGTPEGVAAAEKTFRELLARGVDSPGLRACLGEILWIGERDAEAEAEFDPADAESDLGRAMRAGFLVETGRAAEGLAEARLLRGDAEPLPRALARLVEGEALLRLGRPTEAAQLLRRFSAARLPDASLPARAHLVLGEADVLAGRALESRDPARGERLRRAREEIEAAREGGHLDVRRAARAASLLQEVDRAFPGRGGSDR